MDNRRAGHVSEDGHLQRRRQRIRQLDHQRRLRRSVVSLVRLSLELQMCILSPRELELISVFCLFAVNCTALPSGQSLVTSTVYSTLQGAVAGVTCVNADYTWAAGGAWNTIKYTTCTDQGGTGGWVGSDSCIRELISFVLYSTYVYWCLVVILVYENKLSEQEIVLWSANKGLFIIK